MYLCARTQMLSKYSLNESLKLLKNIGYDGAEISILDENFYAKPELIEDYVIQFNRDLIESLDLKISAVSCHGDYIYNKDRFSLIKKIIPKVKMYNTDILIISGTPKKTNDLEEWSNMIKKTKILVELAEDFGIRIAMEFEPGFIVGTTNDLISLFNDIPSNSLASNLDLGHVFLCDEKPYESIKLLSDKIIHTHIENMQRGVHNHLPPNSGDMDLSKFISYLKLIKYNGALALDLYACEYEKVAISSLPFLRKLISREF